LAGLSAGYHREKFSAPHAADAVGVEHVHHALELAQASRQARIPRSAAAAKAAV
jgi:hypothetical protein